MTENNPRIFVGQPLRVGERYTITGDQHRHVARVLRLKAGARVTLFDGRGGEYSALVEETGRADTRVRAGEHREVDRESSLALRLVQGISRGERTDIAIQKAVELGVTHIVPVLTRRGVVRLDAERAKRRHAHWQGIVVHACQQCGRNRLPELSPVVALESWLREHQRGALDLVLDPDSETSVDGISFHGGLISLLIGPEGGLDERERKAAAAAGFTGVRIGPRTLRTETAAVAGVTAVQLRWGDLGSGG